GIGSDPSAPFTPVQGKGYQRGCAARDAVAFSDNALYWIGDDRIVYKTTSVPSRISSNSLEDRLRQCANIGACAGFTAIFEGHEVYVLNVPGVGSYAYDASRQGFTTLTAVASRGEWGEWTSFGRT
ncbi:MAG: hypothetical protein JOZ27_05140, partial [Caulobacteraceae bacterium]|nr:hypothetical protein [Caulobacteraceae bacterium]